MKRKSSVNFPMILFIISFLVNILLCCWAYLTKTTIREEKIIINTEKSYVYQLSNAETYKKVLIQKDREAYRSLFDSTFEELPVQSFLLSSTFYALTKDSIAKRDMEAVKVELKARYGFAPQASGKSVQ